MLKCARGITLEVGRIVAFAHTGKRGTHTLHRGTIIKVNPKTVTIETRVDNEPIRRMPEQVIVL